MADQEQNENNSAPTEQAPVEQAEAPVEQTEETANETPNEAEVQESAPDTQQQEAIPAEQTPAEEGAPPETQVQEGDDQTVKEGEGVPEGEAAPEAETASASPKPAEEGDAEKAGEEGEKTVEGQEGETEPKAGEEGQQAETAEGGEETQKTEGEEAVPAAEGDSAAPATDGEQKEDVKEGDGETDGEAKPEGETSKSPVPQSDTFAEGERAESPVGVGEKLSREGSPVQQADVPVPDILEPGTPERSRPASAEAEKEHAPLTTFEEEEEDEEEDEESEDDQPEFDREELLEAYHRAIAEREQFQQSNYQLQHKLAEYFRKRKADESRQEYDKNVTDQEQRYLKYMAQLEDLRRQDMLERENYKHQIEELKTRCEERKEKVDEERRKFMDFKKQVALNSLNSRSGRPIAPKDIEQYLSGENRKEAEVVNVRLENIKLKNKLKKKEHQLKSKEELAEGLHLIDFEQLKIENQTYNEKIEERNEELLKLRKKITSTVQVLTHLKEKLQYVQAENQVQKRNLRDVEAEVGQKRDILSRTKQARDALRIDNQKLRQNCGLLGNEALLRDFEERKDEGEDLRDKLEHLKMQHAELTLHCNQVRRKIEQARTGRA